MAIDVYTTGALIAVIDHPDIQPVTWLRDSFFTLETQSESEKIFFDVLDRKKRLAPYVSPRVRGKIMEKEGYSTKAFEPPYLKPKSNIDPNELFRRSAGERMMGAYSASERRAMLIREILRNHEESISRREEVQVSEAVRKGRVTVTGEGYGTVVLAYGRAAGNTVVLTGDNRWSQDGATPLADIETWAETARENSSGAVMTDVICGTKSFQHLLARLTKDDRKDLFDSRRGSESRVELGPRAHRRVQFEGQLGHFDFWTYQDTYHDDDGQAVEVWPENEVALVSRADIEGVRAYAAIRDGRAGYRALRRFPKMWEEQDPSEEYLMTQAAPLMVPLRPNATFGVTTH